MTAGFDSENVVGPVWMFCPTAMNGRFGPSATFVVSSTARIASARERETL